MSVEVTGCDSAVVSWMASQSMFDNVIGNYSVRYQLASGSNDLTTVNTSSTNVTLEDLVPNAEYNVSVVGITSCGGTSSPAMTHLDLQGIFPMHALCVYFTVARVHAHNMHSSIESDHILTCITHTGIVVHI